jgi:hypothetical protein
MRDLERVVMKASGCMGMREVGAAVLLWLWKGELWSCYEEKGPVMRRRSSSAERMGKSTKVMRRRRSSPAERALLL